MKSKFRFLVPYAVAYLGGNITGRIHNWKIWMPIAAITAIAYVLLEDRIRE